MTHRFVLTMVVVLGAASVSAAERPQDRLSLSANTAAEYAGLFETAGSLVFFESRATGPNDIRVSAQVNGIVLDANYDPEQGIVVMDGHGLSVLPLERQALAALALELERQLDPYTRMLPPHQTMLFRLVNYWAEAPVGYPLERLEIRRDAGTRGETLGGTSNATCYQADDDWSRLSGGCRYQTYTLYHDADGGGHCFQAFSQKAGCNHSQKCLGRCGPGCGLGGFGLYYTDCAEHDHCCRDHGSCILPTATKCGDEYMEAAPEFIFGLPNCLLGCLS